MEILQSKKSYLLRKSAQLRQWDRVMENLIIRVHRVKESDKPALLKQIEKIKAKKVSVEHQLHQIETNGEDQWAIDKAAFEKSWKELRDTFSDNAMRSQEE